MKKILFIFSTLVVCVAGFSQEVSFSGDLSTAWGITAPWTENPWDFSLGNTSFTGGIEAYFGNSTAYFDGTAGYNFSEEEIELSVNEAYIDYTSSFWGIRIGRQKWAWGKADGVNITNCIFPQDSSSLFNDDSSLGVDALRLSVNGNTFTADAMWIPFFRGSILPLEDSNPLKKYIIPSAYTISIPEYGISKEASISLGTITNPELNIKNGEYALKLSGYFSAFDISVYGFYGWEKLPTLSYTGNEFDAYGIPSSVTVDGAYNRLCMVGLDAAFPLGPVVLRGECAYFPDRSLQSSAEAILSGEESFVLQHQLKGLAGIDWMKEGWTITAQYYCDYIFDKSDKLEREKDYEHGATLSVSKSFLNETFDLSLSALIGLNYFDSAVSFEAAYSLSDQISLKTGAFVFLGGPEEDGTYGAYKDLSTIYIKAQYSF